MESNIQSLNKNAQIFSNDLNKIIDEMHRVIIGQHEVVEKLILSLVADGHVLLEGMPGLLLDYPTKEQEHEITKMISGEYMPSVQKVISPSRILEIQKFAHSIYMDEKIFRYIIDIVQATRNPDQYGLDAGDLIEYGASPRASIYLALAGKARAMLEGRGYVTPHDIKSIAKDVLRHRIILTYEAIAEDVTTDKIITSILDKVPVP